MEGVFRSTSLITGRSASPCRTGFPHPVKVLPRFPRPSIEPGDHCFGVVVGFGHRAPSRHDVVVAEAKLIYLHSSGARQHALANAVGEDAWLGLAKSKKRKAGAK